MKMRHPMTLRHPVPRNSRCNNLGCRGWSMKCVRVQNVGVCARVRVHVCVREREKYIYIERECVCVWLYYCATSQMSRSSPCNKRSSHCNKRSSPCNKLGCRGWSTYVCVCVCVRERAFAKDLFVHYQSWGNYM